jgi:hypothetical protein
MNWVRSAVQFNNRFQSALNDVAANALSADPLLAAAALVSYTRLAREYAPLKLPKRAD